METGFFLFFFSHNYTNPARNPCRDEGPLPGTPGNDLSPEFRGRVFSVKAPGMKPIRDYLLL
jgi:hypothetical protein